MQSPVRPKPPTDAELAALGLGIKVPPKDVMQDIQHKAEEIKRKTPRGQQVEYAEVKAPSDVVVAYGMAKAAARSSPLFPDQSSNIYSLASVPLDARKSYVDIFDSGPDSPMR